LTLLTKERNPMPTKSHTEELPDGTVGAWFTDENDVEQYLGSFRDERTAQFAVDGALETVEARRPEEPEAAPAPAKSAKSAKS
jgi:hypothetical protein